MPPPRTVPETLALLLGPGAVAELRAIGRDGRIASGYFDDPALLAQKADALDASGDYSGIYVTLNPVDPALLARRANRVATRLGRRDATTADGDVLARRWLPIDIDPVRPSGISATEPEREAAFATAAAVRDHLAGLGWPAPVEADSGNGAHLLYRVDLPNDDPSAALVRGVLAALDAGFSTPAAKVDTANANAARIWKVYGTVSRKGDPTPDRPHRRAAVLAAPPAPEPVPLERLRALAPPATVPPAAIPAPPPTAVPAAGTLDLRAWLEGHGIAIASQKPWQGGTLYTLADCPFSDAHADGAYAVQFESGAVHAGCLHDSCGSGRQRWRELRERFEPPGPPAAAAEVAVPSRAPSPPADPDAVARAREILEAGDPLAYFLAAFERDHVGDETLARCLVMSIASQAVRNTRGLHVYVTGESGKGKSSGMIAMLRQVPDEFRLAERLSNKALYYSDDIRPGTVLMLDDIALSEELQEVLKEATSRFTEPVRMRTVDRDRRVRHCAIPERCAWWLANVSALYDDQVLNRMLTCWVDDSEAQDREVFARRMAAVARGDDLDDADRFDLAVCRECWRQLRAGGPVTVRIPFADRIRMASLRNCRNHEVLLDLVRAHALLVRFQREEVPQDDGTTAIVATGEDFERAARLFCELHTTGGSLGSKLDRNEELVLATAARSEAEQFTVRDVQDWTGWQYAKAHRVLTGYRLRGARYPGLLDRTAALSLVDQTVSEADGEGRSVRRRALVFTFDLEAYRAGLHRGEVWLEGDPSRITRINDSPDGRGDVKPIRGRKRAASGNGGEIGPFENGSSINRRARELDDGAPLSTHALSSDDNDVRGYRETAGYPPDTVSANVSPPDGFPSTSSITPKPDANDARTSVDPRGFLGLEVPAPEECCACGARPTHYRELRPRGSPRHLCRRCRAAAVRREQRARPPLPAVIETAGLRRVTASVGRCDVCGLEPAAWSGGGVRLCEACFRRELRRGVARGLDGPTPA